MLDENPDIGTQQYIAPSIRNKHLDVEVSTPANDFQT